MNRNAKNQLIQLGATKPELQPHIRKVLAQAEKVANPDSTTIAILNLRELLSKSGLENYSRIIEKEVINLLRNPKGGKSDVPVKVPNGFSTLFKSIDINLRVSKRDDNPHIDLHWTYQHPGGGGNGYFLGLATVDGWRMSSGTVGGKVLRP